MHPVTDDAGGVPDRPLREIACDESGYEGEHLVGGVTAVFAHAGVDLDIDEAAACVAALRTRIRSPAVEYKANHLLRAKHRDALEWLLGEVRGRGTVHLVDKAALATVRLAELLTGATRAAGVARHRAALDTVGMDRWWALLATFEAVLRARGDADLAAADAAFRAAAIPFGAQLSAAAPQAALLRAADLADPPDVPPLDPLPPALAATVDRWSADGTPVAVVHDRQTTLTPARIARLRADRPALVGVRLVGSRSDPRVQIADFVAGVAYRIAADELAGCGDPALVDLLRPYVDPASMWADERSGATLGITGSPGQDAVGGYTQAHRTT